jgi:hypothetical protein
MHNFLQKAGEKPKPVASSLPGSKQVLLQNLCNEEDRGYPSPRREPACPPGDKFDDLVGPRLARSYFVLEALQGV